MTQIKSTRGGYRPSAGGLVQSIVAGKATWQQLRTLMLARYGKADKATISRWFAGMVAAEWQEYDAVIQTQAAELAEVE